MPMDMDILGGQKINIQKVDLTDTSSNCVLAFLLQNRKPYSKVNRAHTNTPTMKNTSCIVTIPRDSWYIIRTTCWHH